MTLEERAKQFTLGWGLDPAGVAALGILLKAVRREALEEAEQKIFDLRHAAAANFGPGYTGNEGMARTDSFAEAAKAVANLKP